MDCLKMLSMYALRHKGRHLDAGGKDKWRSRRE